MIIGIERITIEVPNINIATNEYQCLFGEVSLSSKYHRIIPLDNATIELKENSSILNSKIADITFLDDNASLESTCIFPSPRKIKMNRIGTRLFKPEKKSNQEIFAVDHIVLMSNNLDSCIKEFGENGLGIRLALDKNEPSWGGRMLFFRTGKLTIEILQNNNPLQREDYFWGVAYLCSDIHATLTNLDKSGISHSVIREGRKNGTLVSTIKSHNLGLPTILIQKTQC